MSKVRSPFEPSLVQPDAVRGQVKAEVHGVAKGIKPFEQLASVLSAGTLNTAALSLFLALHLIEVPRHRLLILDDPVQNMDDIHVVQMASLFRSLARQSHRQLIIAVHERALFEYLSLELGPAKEGDSLITIELAYDSMNESTQVSHAKRIWKPDHLRFGGPTSKQAG